MQSSNDRLRAGGGGPESPPENPGHHVPAPAAAPGTVGYEDPWYDALASGWGELDTAGRSAATIPVPAAAVPVVPAARAAEEPAESVAEGPAEEPRGAAEVYLQVQRSAAFQEVRRRYRRFVIPAVAVFLTWYLAYVVTATTAPGFMGRHVAGAVNVAMVAGLGQFLSTFLLTWAYARHARLRRDRAALDLRWDTQELTRGLRGGAS